MTSPYSITIETENEKGTKEFEEEIFGKMKDMMQSITKDLFKKPIITFHISYSNGNSFVVWRKETINKQGMFTKHILCYKKTREEAEFSKQRYELKHKKGIIFNSIPNLMDGVQLNYRRYRNANKKQI